VFFSQISLEILPLHPQKYKVNIEKYYYRLEKYILKYDKTFTFECGKTIDNLELCYHTSGEYCDNKKVIWICHALTANSNPEEWWDLFVGKNKFFDTDKYFIICVNMLGSCYGSSGPASIDVNAERKNKLTNRYLLDFPEVSVRDIVEAHKIVKNHIKIKAIDLIIGGSIGGFQALEWSISEPELIKCSVLIACNARVSPWGTAFNESQRMAVLADNTFGEQKNIDGGKKGLEAARSIALLSYRSHEGYGITQKEENVDTLFANKACSYQQYQGKKLSNRFDAYSYYYLSKSIDSHNVGRGRGGVEKALAAITAKTICIGIDSDVLFPVEEQKFLAKHINNAEYFEIKSQFGHDGFLLEWMQIQKILKEKCGERIKN
ncbi:MAG: homoserine O-acetyltransferase, partial [Prevotellaceae bacterium]|jgi:homoserine O-acetyltransferase|nr:homoserine O-acetyltransferase [Prevotellaceae bacterium]